MAAEQESTDGIHSLKDAFVELIAEQKTPGQTFGEMLDQQTMSFDEQFKSLFKAQLTTGYSKWIAENGTIVGPGVINCIVDQMDKLSAPTVKAVIEGHTEFIFDAVEGDPSLFVPAQPPSSLDCPALLEKKSGVSPEGHIYVLEKQKQELMSHQFTPGAESEGTLTIAKLDQSIAALKAYMGEDAAIIKGMTPDMVIIDDIDKVDKGPTPGGDPPASFYNKSLTEKEISSMFGISAQYIGVDPAKKYKQEDYTCQIPDCGHESHGYPTADYSMIEIKAMDHATSKLKKVNFGVDVDLDGPTLCKDCHVGIATWFAHSPEECKDPECDCEPQCKKCLFTEVYGGTPGIDVIGNKKDVALSLGFPSSMLKQKIMSGLLGHLPPLPELPATHDLPAPIKTHTHLLEGKRQRCINDSCPVGS